MTRQTVHSVWCVQQHIRGVCAEEGGAAGAEAREAPDGQAGRQEEGQRDVGEEQDDSLRYRVYMFPLMLGQKTSCFRFGGVRPNFKEQ